MWACYWLAVLHSEIVPEEQVAPRSEAALHLELVPVAPAARVALVSSVAAVPRLELEPEGLAALAALALPVAAVQAELFLAAERTTATGKRMKAG